MALAAVRSKGGGGSFVVASVLIVAHIVGFCNCSMLCALLCVHSSFAIIRMGRRKLVACFVCLAGVS